MTTLFGQIGVLQQFGGDGAVGGDGHLAQGGKVTAGLGEHHGLALLVGHLLALHLSVGVTVDKGGQTGGVLDHVQAGIGSGAFVRAQVSQGHHVVSFLSGSVNGVLNQAVKNGAVLPFAEGEDDVALFVHEVGWGGLGNGLRGGDAHDGHLLAAHLIDLVGIRKGLSVTEHVTGQVVKLGILQHRHVAKVVIAQGGRIVPGGVHDVDDHVGGVDIAIDRILNVVAGIQQKYVLQAVPVAGHHGVGDLLAEVGVNIVGIKDCDVFLFRGKGRGYQRRRHSQRHGQRQEPFVLFHCYHLFFFDFAQK